ncbi:MAG: hypothetical protein E7Z87_08060 [Cyanobacteria bacterium SIG26]|nr:hypothetical protein [Cyanobacteria bacterium SIG26]
MKKLQIITLAIIVSTGLGICTNKITTYAANITKTAISAPSAPQVEYTDVNALEIVSNPYRYMKRNIRIRGKFDKFSTLGLDYAPAMRSSEKYISFLIQRPDITNHNIPLSELKIFLKKEVAEKNIDLDAGDEIEFTGRVFSTALGDAWMDVDEFKVTKKVNHNSDKK